jgi:hypothetical protein
VVVEFEPQSRIEGEIQQMPADFPVTEFWRRAQGPALRALPGAQSPEEVTIFDSVGFALEDYSALRLLRVQRHRIQAVALAQPAVPVVADRHMADFVAQDHVEDLDGTQAAGAHLPQLVLDLRRGVQPARFQRARHQRHAREHVAGGLLAHQPQAVVRIEVAVAWPSVCRCVGQQVK